VWELHLQKTKAGTVPMATDMARNKIGYSAHNERVLLDKENTKGSLGLFHLTPRSFSAAES
jgi:hypothetical protein